MSTKASSTAATTQTRKSTGAKTTKKSSGTKRGSSAKRKPGQLPTEEGKQPKYEATDKFQIIADKLLAIMAEGTLPWRRPWWVEPCANLISGHEYTGLNPLLAEIDVAEKGYSKSLFVGYKQAVAQGWKVCKGSKATYLRWVGAVPKKDEDGEETGEVIRLPRWVPVFNVDCIDDENSEIKVQDLAAKFDRPANSAPRIEAAEALITAQSATVVFGGNRASYNASEDFIRMPRYRDFSSAEAYYAVHIHELIHWTAHPSRLNRPIFSRFGTQAYAFEELVAELGAVFVCSHLGITPCLENHASYLDEWRCIIASDNRAFFRAATLARDAANYLLENAGMLTNNTNLESADQDELVAAA